QQFDLVLLDPPRVGAGRDVVQALLRLNLERIIYISCDPITLVRDLALLRQGYRVVSSQVFDLFPQTYHLESVTLLERR
ncbi:MAG TPA: 23S rRNA (uracil(1939)-C(5))-methyltransferase RlmD, partial [Geothermobacteraceae bacterium]|nr:23S rRNA (uracil(1939)-C(5))-methyltransferase RlmD [Geothermobacteraceae bacterium]